METINDNKPPVGDADKLSKTLRILCKKCTDKTCEETSVRNKQINFKDVLDAIKISTNIIKTQDANRAQGDSGLSYYTTSFSTNNYGLTVIAYRITTKTKSSPKTARRYSIKVLGKNKKKEYSHQCFKNEITEVIYNYMRKKYVAPLPKKSSQHCGR